MKRVFVAGSFDMLHSGHITFLKRAAQFGELFIGIGSDYSVKKYKGKSPVCNEQERLFMVKSVRYVLDAWINSGEGSFDYKEDLKHIEPDIVIVNEEQTSDEKEVACKKLGIEYIILRRTQESGFPVRSTTKYRKLCK